MKAVSYQKFGSTAVLQMVEEAKPSLQPHQVLVRVKAVSLNPIDWKIRKGQMKLMSGSKFPRHTAVDFSGIIEDTGSSVADFKKGDEVFGVVKNTMKDGAMAEYVAVPSTLVWKKPVNISFPEAAALPVVGFAAVTALNKMGRINSQTKILVNGATGGFGMVLLQLLKKTGADVTAVASTKGIESAKKWGANGVVDYSKENILSQSISYDIVIDLSGKLSYRTVKKIMKQKALFLNATPKPIDIISSLFTNLFNDRKHIPILSGASGDNMQVLLNAISAGLQIEVNKIFPFSAYKNAYEYAEQGGYVGKVVVEIN